MTLLMTNNHCLGVMFSLNRQLLCKKDYNRLVVSWNNASDWICLQPRTHNHAITHYKKKGQFRLEILFVHFNLRRQREKSNTQLIWGQETACLVYFASGKIPVKNRSFLKRWLCQKKTQFATSSVYKLYGAMLFKMARKCHNIERQLYLAANRFTLNQESC